MPAMLNNAGILASSVRGAFNCGIIQHTKILKSQQKDFTSVRANNEHQTNRQEESELAYHPQ